MKRALADVLWEAANRLSPDGDWFKGDEYSCCAVLNLIDRICYDCLPSDAASSDWQHASDLYVQASRAAKAFLKSLGCPVSSSKQKFGQKHGGPERQGARYMWLLLAMHVAEDEGIEIEVPA